MHTSRIRSLRRVGVAGAAVAVTAAAGAAGWLPVSLVDALVLVGLAVVVPLTAGAFPSSWAIACASAGMGFALPRGPAALAVLPAVALGFLRLLEEVRVDAAYALVATLALLQSRSGVIVFDLHEPIVELTAVHFSFAGAGAVFLATRAREGRPHARLGPAAFILTTAAPPLVALGFVTRSPVAQVGGALVMTMGVWSTAALELADAARARSQRVRVLLVVSGLSIWVPMILAVSWAAGQHWDVPMLSIRAMVRLHGLANALGFTVCGLVARWLEAAAQRPTMVVA